MNDVKCSIFFHNYYGEHNSWINFLLENFDLHFNLYYNVVNESIYNLKSGDDIETLCKNSDSKGLIQKLFIRSSTNQGKDIGGKLVLFDTYLRLGQETEFIIFLHDKISPHSVHGIEWQRKLFKIVVPGFARKAVDLFTNDSRTGIVASKNTVQNEPGPNISPFLNDLSKRFEIRTSDYDYIAGTMFWVRSALLKKFFLKYDPMDIRRTLEKGNVMDEFKETNTHAWERLLCWIVTGQGYKIKQS